MFSGLGNLKTNAAPNHRLTQGETHPLQMLESSASRHIIPCGKLLLLISGLAWMYWTDLVSMQTQWEANPQYSHGYLVPVFALALLFMRHDRLEPTKWRASWSGVLLLSLGLGLKLFSTYFYIESLGHLSLLISIAGATVALWGLDGLKWAFPGIAFLVFMLPLPHSMEGALQGPLRSVGTNVSTFFLQTIGLPAYSEGHVIIVGEHFIGVAEACSGLRMLMVFFALSTAVAMVLSESWLFRLGIIASAVPIAIIANMFRIASTGAIYVYMSDTTIWGMKGTEFAHTLFHDWAGWLMIPVALMLLWLEIWILEHSVIRVPDRPVSAGIGTHFAEEQVIPANQKQGSTPS